MPDEKANSGIVSIDSLPKDLETVDRPPLASGAPSVPHVEDSYQGGILSASLGLQTDTAATQLPGTIPVFRLQTVPPSGQPTVGAAAQNATIIAGGGGQVAGASTIGLNIPSIFTPVSQVMAFPGPLVFGLAAEPASTFFAAPAITSGGASFIDQQATIGSSTSTTVSLSLTPSRANEWALFGYVAGGQGTHYAPSGLGWSAIYTGYFGAALYLSSPSTGVLNAVATLDTPNKPAAGFLGLFQTTGSVPSVLQQNSLTGALSAGASSTIFTNPLTAGSTIFALLQANTTAGGTLATPTITDTYGNIWTLVSFIQTGTATGCATGLWISSLPSPSTATITLNLSTYVSSASFVIFEVSNLTAVPGVPSFRPIVGNDLPNPTISSKGGVYAVTPVTNDFVSSINLSGQPVLAQPAYANLSGDPSQAVQGTFLGDATTLVGKITYITTAADRGHMLILPNTAVSSCTITLANSFYGWFLNTSSTILVNLVVGSIATQGLGPNVTLMPGKSMFVVYDNNGNYQAMLSA